MPDRMPHRHRMSDRIECQKECQIECKIECQIECQKEYLLLDRLSDRMSENMSDRMECQNIFKICPNVLADMSWHVVVGITRSKVISSVFFFRLYNCYSIQFYIGSLLVFDFIFGFVRANCQRVANWGWTVEWIPQWKANQCWMQGWLQDGWVWLPEHDASGGCHCLPRQGPAWLQGRVRWCKEPSPSHASEVPINLPQQRGEVWANQLCRAVLRGGIYDRVWCGQIVGILTQGSQDGEGCVVEVGGWIWANPRLVLLLSRDEPRSCRIHQKNQSWKCHLCEKGRRSDVERHTTANRAGGWSHANGFAAVHGEPLLSREMRWPIPLGKLCLFAWEGRALERGMVHEREREKLRTSFISRFRFTMIHPAWSWSSIPSIQNRPAVSSNLIQLKPTFMVWKASLYFLVLINQFIILYYCVTVIIWYVWYVIQLF